MQQEGSASLGELLGSDRAGFVELLPESARDDLARSIAQLLECERAEINVEVDAALAALPALLRGLATRALARDEA